MRIKHIFLQNFCKFYGSNVVDTDLYDRTDVSDIYDISLRLAVPNRNFTLIIAQPARFV